MATQWRKVSWKRNIRKLPESIQAKLEKDPKMDFVAGAVKCFSAMDISSGLLAHLGIGNNPVAYPLRITPPFDMGRHSKKNRQGWEVIRRDLPQESFILSFDAPNFGDYAKGTHNVSQTRWRYRRDIIPPPMLELVIEHLGSNDDGDIILKATVDAPSFTSSGKIDNTDLMFALNLLQENIGACDVFSRTASNVELLASNNVSWEFFPKGERLDEVMNKLLEGASYITADQQFVMRERAKMFMDLGGQIIRCTTGFTRYIAARFADDLVVLENFHYGNALYVLYDDWQTLSKLSRIELLRATTRHRFDRFIHRDGWKKAFTEHIQSEMAKRNIPKQNVA